VLYWRDSSEPKKHSSYDRAIAVRLANVLAYSNRGIGLRRLSRSEEAFTRVDPASALALEPNDDEIYHQPGVSEMHVGQTENAVASHGKAIAIDPEVAVPHWNKSLLLLRMGRYEEGWALHECRWKLKEIKARRAFSPSQPLWLGGESLVGKTILLHAEQGLGDTIQFCRYAKLVKALGATVLLEVPKALMALLSELEGVDRLIERGTEAPAFDYHCPLMSLPMAFKTRLDTIPSGAKYLHAQAAKVGQWQQRLGPAQRPRVGLVWSGGFRPDQPELRAVNQRRNLPLEQLKALKGMDLDFISLQKGEPAESEFAAAQQAGWDGPAIANYSADLQDFSDTAALIETLDLVISVDTSVAHLAAAMGKSVWILNRFDSCWRWLQDRSDSPWYPTVRLYNQRSAEDWEEVMQRVRGDLQHVAPVPVPQNVATLLQQGQALLQQGKVAAAETLYQQVLVHDPKNFDALYLMGAMAAQTNQLAQAVNWMGRALEVDSGHAELHFNRGVALQKLLHHGEALASYDAAIALQPKNAQAHLNRGLVLQRVNRVEEALASFERAIAIAPTHAQAHMNRGCALHLLKRTEEALDSFDKAIAFQPDLAAAQLNRGIALQDLNRVGEAIENYDRCIALNPNDAAAHYKRGIALKELDCIKDALASYDKAAAINPNDPEIQWNRSLLLLSLGQWDEGWKLYQSRWKLSGRTNLGARYHLAQPPWLGHESLEGKTILLHAEQGLGDTIQFCRYAKLVKALGATVLLEVPRALIGLLSQLEGVDRLIERGTEAPAFDYHCPLMSLPLAFKTRLDTIPSSPSYLHAQATKVAQWQQRLGPALRPRVGLVWSGGFRPDQPELWALNKRRNLPLDQLKVLKGMDVDFISLQKGEPAESDFVSAMQAGWDGPAIANYSADLQDFSDTAALIETLDLVISVDTSVAHLAAALGKPVWILNRFDSCWRWLQDRSDSPWYPTVRLYNQRSAGDWEEVMHRVRQDLLARPG
jgi:tetratricopeptide (TPR) repeat protein